MKKICIIVLLLLAGLLSRAQDQPNIVFILADDMGYSDMSWQGSPIETPNLDKLAAGGMFLSRNYVQPQCTPTRVAFLTGNYPYRYGLHEHVLGTQSMHGIPAGEKTIAEKMREGGYRTAVIGKWHAGCYLESFLPENQGFDHAFYCLHGQISYWNYTVGPSSTVVRNGEKVYAPSMEDGEESGNPYATEMWRDEAVNLILGHDQKKPLFLYLPFNAPHAPFHAPQKLLDKYMGTDIDPYWSGPGAVLGRNEGNRRLYMAMVDALDQAIGEVMKALEEAGMLGNTLIVFCSDNGGIEEADNRPLRSYKGDSFEGGVRVPGIAFWPGKIKPGSSSSELVYAADWYATFSEIAGMSSSGEEKDGISALDVLLGGKGQRDHVPIISAARHAYITRDYSLVGSGENYARILNREMSGFRLYDLAADVSQEEPTREHPQVEREMKEALRTHFHRVHKGYFNWDVAYGKYGWETFGGDHDLDQVRDDMPEIRIVKKGPAKGISVSPVKDELVYLLQGRSEGHDWTDLAEYVCREDADEYRFPDLDLDRKMKDFRVQTRFHYGLPIHESFSGEVEGFLPISDETEGIEIHENSLSYEGIPEAGGALHLSSRGAEANPYMTRYFVQPICRGKVYASMLVQFDGRQEESVGEVNFLVQNGWNGPTEKQVSLTFQQDGIYLDQADGVPPDTKRWLGEHHREVVRVLFEFDLGPLGQDELKVYLNPPSGGDLPQPNAILRGEFSFDRLQFRLTARPYSDMTVDEVHVGSRLSEVFP